MDKSDTNAILAEASHLSDTELGELLPPGIQHLLEMMPAHAVIRLVHIFGGTRVYIPRSISYVNELRGIFSSAEWKRLIDYMAGEELVVPRAVGLLRGLRNKLIVANRESGEPVKIIARRYQLTERQVWNITSEHKDRMQSLEDMNND